MTQLKLANTNNIQFDQLFRLDHGREVSRVAFLQQFHRPGMTHFNDDVYVGASYDEFIGYLRGKFKQVNEYLPGDTGDHGRVGEVICSDEDGNVELAMRILSSQNGDDEYLSHNIEIHDAVTSFAIKRDLQNWVMQHPRKRRPHPPGVYGLRFVERFISRIGAMDNKVWRMDTTDFDHLNDSLYPGLDIPMMIKEFVDSDECILILTGKPGLGKTCLIKRFMYGVAMYQEESQTALYIKDNRVLHTPSFWAELADESFDFMILDDLDNELTPRAALDTQIQETGKEVRDTIVNQLLSFSDGLFPNNLKVIITTNLIDQGIDSALLRPGRCFDVLELQPLSRQNAHTIWTQEYGLSEELFLASFGNREVITQAFLMSEMQRRTRNNEKTYLIDKSLSVREKYA